MALTSSMLLDRRYELEERIGAGGFSEVWRATDRVLRRPVAVKMLHPQYAVDMQTQERFRVEARNAGSLAHENIARVYDYGEPVPRRPPFLVMELVPGPSLAQVLAGGALDPARSMRIVAQAAAGLHAAHAAGLVHRDIKPGNLLLAPGDLVKITDFGIAHAVGSAPVTESGIVMGTAGYLSPERAAGMRGTPASDLYALGVVAYECLVGAAPFPPEAGLDGPAPGERPMPALPTSVPAAAAVLVMELTALDPAARPSAAQTAQRAAQAADHAPGGAAGPEAVWLAPGGPGLPAQTTPTRGLLPPPGRHVARSRRARTVIVAAAALTAVVAAVTLVSVIGSGPQPRPLPVPASSQSPKAAAPPASNANRPHGDNPSGRGPGPGPGHGNGNGRGDGDGQRPGHGGGDGSDGSDGGA
jgi:eukaryotic-like serine/threonine-protein kinase